VFARVADVVSTRFATPNLRLEANPVARKLGWPFAWATLGLAVVPYLSDWGPNLAVVIVVMSLVVASSNVGRSWAMRAAGEAEYLAWLRGLYARARPAEVYGAIAVSSALFASLGFLLWLFYPEPDEWGYWFAYGLLATALAICLHSCLFARRMFAEVRGSPAQDTAEASATSS
jgi:hypothetical protein